MGFLSFFWVSSNWRLPTLFASLFSIHNLLFSSFSVIRNRHFISIELMLSFAMDMCSVTEIHGFPPVAATLSSSSPSPGLSVGSGRQPVTVGWWSSPVRTRHRELPISTSFTPKHSPASLSTPSPSPRSTGSSDAFSPSLRAGSSDFWSSSPSPCNDPWRPYSCEPRHSGSGGSTVSSPGTTDALPQPGSTSSLGLSLSGTLRQRQAFNLPCSPQTPKPFDRYCSCSTLLVTLAQSCSCGLRTAL